jgi:hypothetical protein
MVCVGIESLAADQLIDGKGSAELDDPGHTDINPWSVIRPWIGHSGRFGWLCDNSFWKSDRYFLSFG